MVSACGHSWPKSFFFFFLRDQYCCEKWVPANIVAKVYTVCDPVLRATEKSTPSERNACSIGMSRLNSGL